MRRDLLQDVAEEKDVTNVIVLTHNIDFVFVQTVVLSVLRRCGNPSLTIFADASCAANSFAHQAPVLHGLGVRYRVVPVEMAPGFRFHPKAVLLTGPASAALYVGSGNLTFGGWRENGEVWLRFDARADGTQAFASFLRYLSALVELIVLPEHVRTEIEEAFDAKTHAWAAELTEPGAVFGRIGRGPSLLDQMLARVPEGIPERITVCAPYFDAKAEVLSEIVERFSPIPVDVLVQPGRTGLTEAAWARVGGSGHLMPIGFQRSDDRGKVRESFLHAKFYAFERAGRVTVFAGSANCSRAALTRSETDGNAELMATLNMSTGEFRASLMEELVLRDGAPGLAPELPEADPMTAAGLRILGASHEGGYLRVGFVPRDWHIVACTADDVRMEVERIGAGVIGAQLEHAPRYVQLDGTDGRTTMQSLPAWVDHEWELRSTARGRNVVDAIRRRVRTGQWGIGAWSEVFDAFCAHLRYLPARVSVGRSAGSGSEQDDLPRVQYSAKDVFAAGYGLPALNAFLPPSMYGLEGRVRSLQELLLRWFGVPISDRQSGADEVFHGEPGDGGEDLVDRLEDLPTAPVTAGVAARGERERGRVEKLVTQMAEAMTSAEFLRERPPDLLGGDLKIASALLRVALREGWLDPDIFFRTTNWIWIPLFFDAEGDGRGWLQRRYEAVAAQDEFVTNMRSPELLAALVAWALAVPDELRTPASARFSLAFALAIARLPWLWDGVDDEAVCRELADLLAHTLPTSSSDTALGADAVGNRWLQLLQRGHSLRRLERTLDGWTPAGLAPRIARKQLAKGELLWQGTGGFCIVTNPEPRVTGCVVSVLPLRRDLEHARQEEENRRRQKRSKRKLDLRRQTHDTTGEVKFSAELTVPLAALLDVAVVPLTEDFGQRPREVLRAFLAELAEGFGGGRA